MKSVLGIKNTFSLKKTFKEQKESCGQSTNRKWTGLGLFLIVIETGHGYIRIVK